jgi:hypothetical protein
MPLALISLIRDPVIPEGWQHVAGGSAKRHPRFLSDDDPIPEGSQNEQVYAFSSVPFEKSVVIISALKGSHNPVYII